MMTGQWLFIEADDVWMFRDSKPFNAQQNFVARSQFPPNPQTIQGVIRTAYLESQGVDWQRYKDGHERSELYETVGHSGIKDAHSGMKDEPPTMGQLRLTGPLLARRVELDGGKQWDIEPLIGAPQDLLYMREEARFATLQLDRSDWFVTGGVSDHWMPLKRQAGEGFKEANGWLTGNQFTAYLENQDIDGSLIDQEDVFEYEDRIGLGLHYRRKAAQDGLLYRARFVRPCDHVGLLVHLNQTLFADSGFLRIGGESRSGRYQVLDNFTFPQPPVAGNIKVVMLTPAYFADGWQPIQGDWSPWVGEGTLVSAVIGKPVAISGWDVANNRSKPLRHFVPAGSVYYFEHASFIGKPFTETPPGNFPEANFGAMGFGSYALGTW